MGVQETVMSYWNVLPNSLKFAVLITMGTAFFTKVATMGLMDQQSIRTDVIASSMSFINMHEGSSVDITWDRVPFVMAIPDGALVTLFETEAATVAPYPLTVPPEGSAEHDGVPYFKGDNVEDFHFENNGTLEVTAK